MRLYLYTWVLQEVSDIGSSVRSWGGVDDNINTDIFDSTSVSLRLLGPFSRKSNMSKVRRENMMQHMPLRAAISIRPMSSGVG